MSRVRLWQFGLIAGAFLLLEILCRTQIINPFTMIPPTQMVVGLFEAAVNKPWFWPDVSYTLFNIAAAVAISIVGGFVIGLGLHAIPRLRCAIDPILTSYYAVPTFILYPLLIVFCGIGPLSLIVMGALFGIVAMVVATLAALDRIPRVMLKVAQVTRLDPMRATLLLKLPAAAPHLMSGLRLAVAYSIIGIIAGEFILSTAGIGRRVALSYNNFDNATMYGLLVLILGFAAGVNALLGAFEHALRRRWYHQS